VRFMTDKMIMEEEKGPHAVAVGDPLRGYIFFGPFPTGRDALDWADKALNGGPDYTMIPLETPT